MLIQQVMHISIYSILSLDKFISIYNTCEEQDKTFALLSQKKLQSITFNFNKNNCKSLIKKNKKSTSNIKDIFLV
jgi:hypothetical protein